VGCRAKNKQKSGLKFKEETIIRAYLCKVLEKDEEDQLDRNMRNEKFYIE
jgi:hypothetical protein